MQTFKEALKANYLNTILTLAEKSYVKFPDSDSHLVLTLNDKTQVVGSRAQMAKLICEAAQEYQNKFHVFYRACKKGTGDIHIFVSRGY